MYPPCLLVCDVHACHGAAFGYVKFNFAVPSIDLFDGALLPAPLEFKRQLMGDQEMMVTSLVESMATKQVFLDVKTVNQLVEYVSDSPGEDEPRLLVLIGPIKSGKSLVLNSVLSRTNKCTLCHCYESNPTRHSVYLYRNTVPTSSCVVTH
jgi:hypothetical protein